MSFANVFSTEPYPGQRLTHGSYSGGNLVLVTEADSALPGSGDTGDPRLFRREAGKNTLFVNVLAKGDANGTAKVQVYGIDPLLQANILLGEATVKVGASGQTDVADQGSAGFYCATSNMDVLVWLASYNLSGTGSGVAISAFTGVLL